MSSVLDTSHFQITHSEIFKANQAVPPHSGMVGILKICMPKFKTTLATAKYGEKPTFYFRAPGRVNLIGEHVDYSGYPVLPFALEQDMVVAVSNITSTPGTLNIANVNEDVYAPLSVDITGAVEIDMAKFHWTNYVLAAWKGVQNAAPQAKFKGLNLLYTGNVPIGSGVSSSSALVCVSTLAISYINGFSYTKEDLANISVKCERYVGIEGGGMDQAISYLAEANTAKLIEFNPLRTNNVHLPTGVSFVICNSLVESNKVVTGAFYYNLRVVECRLAAVLLAHKLGLAWDGVRKLIDVQKLSGLSLKELVEATETHLHPEAYTREEVATALNISVEQLVANYFPSGIRVEAEAFALHARALHVYSETGRVYAFAEKCRANINNSGADASSPAELGQLMDASHMSCAKQFECSCPELDRLTTICRQAGALGSRLTGAGWGGCVISLVPSAIATQFMATIEQEYYSTLAKLPADKSSYMFCTTPSKGACVVALHLHHYNDKLISLSGDAKIGDRIFSNDNISKEDEKIATATVLHYNIWTQHRLLSSLNYSNWISCKINKYKERVYQSLEQEEYNKESQRKRDQWRLEEELQKKKIEEEKSLNLHVTQSQPTSKGDETTDIVASGSTKEDQ
eukprot:gene19106-22882_t